MDRLTSTDLAVTDNGQSIASERLQVLDEHSAAAPAQLLIVLDVINSSQEEFVRSQAAVAAFLRERDGILRQPTSILFLAAGMADSKQSSNDTAVLHERHLTVHRLPTTEDGLKLARDLEDYAKRIYGTPEASSGSGMSDKVRLSLEALSFIAQAESTVPGAKVTLWLSPGWPYLSRSDAKSSAQLFDSVVYFSNTLRTARILLYMVDPRGMTNQSTSAQTEAFLLASRPSSIQAAGHAPDVPSNIGQDFYKSYLKGVRRPEESNPNDLTLQVLAIQSGGAVIQQDNDVKASIDHCAEDVFRLVGVAYRPEQVGGVTEYHDLRIKITRPSEGLRSRVGFYSR